MSKIILFIKKLTIIYDLFENNVKQISFNNNFIVLGPLISTSFNDIIKITKMFHMIFMLLKYLI